MLDNLGDLLKGFLYAAIVLFLYANIVLGGAIAIDMESEERKASHLGVGILLIAIGVLGLLLLSAQMWPGWMSIFTDRLAGMSMEQNTILALTQGFFLIMGHLIIWSGLVAIFAAIQIAVWKGSGFEHIIRLSAFLAGPLVLLAGKAMGVSMIDVLFRSISLTNPFAMGFLGLLFPGALGVLLAWFFIRGLKRSSDIATRIMIFIGTTVMFQFGEVYAAAYQQSGGAIDANFAPNITFTLALLLYLIFNYKQPTRE